MAEAALGIEARAAFDSLECVACGLCLEVCPTYALKRDEGSGPRGRIRLMELLARGEPDRGQWLFHLEECVGCLACQARCPAGAPFGEMLEGAHARLSAERRRGALRRWALGGLLARPRRLRRLRLPLRFFLALRLPRLLLALRLQRLPGLGWLRGLAWLPRRLEYRRAPGPREAGRFVFFPGCVGGLFFPAEEAAALRLLDAAGGYCIPRRWSCCGAVHRHVGDREGAAELARRNIAACEGSDAPVVTHAAGCGAALKDYGRWLADDPTWAGRAARFSARVRDLSEVLEPALLRGGGLRRPRRVAYDDACHAVHAQGIGEGPRALLDALPGITRAEMPHPEHCCGAGGTWFLRHEELSRAMIAGKLDELAGSGADTLLTANPGCRLQWEAALSGSDLQVEVRHPAELWAEALDAEGRGGKTC